MEKWHFEAPCDRTPESIGRQAVEVVCHSQAETVAEQCQLALAQCSGRPELSDRRNQEVAKIRFIQEGESTVTRR